MERFLAKKLYNYSTKLPTKSEEIDLTLKLSPCGQNAEEKRLTRSSSMAGEISKSTDCTVANGPQRGPFVPSLDRSCSLPAEAEKGLMRFGDLQTIRRAEAGRRLLLEQQRRAAAAERDKTPVVSPELLPWVRVAASAVMSPALACANDKLKALANPSGDSKREGGLYDIPYMGPRGSAEGGVSSNIQTSPNQEDNSMVSPKTMFKDMQPSPADTQLENPSKKPKLGNYCSLKGDVMEILRQMPSVTTTGDGPNGKRIEGFLYKYRTGQVCIVCVCHGSFLTPTEFVLHAGGKKMENPMKHITVCCSSF